MKVCLYLEFYHFLGGIFFKNIGTGLLSSYKNQKKMLDRMGIVYSEKWDPTCDILLINTPWIWSLVLIGRARRMGKKVVIWSHVTVEDAMQVFRFMPYIAPLVKKYLTYAYGQADIIFSPSEYTKKLLVAYGLLADKILVRSNAVDTSKFFPRRVEHQGIVVGTVALVIPRKGIDTFLKLADKFPNNPFVWNGKIYSSLMVKSLPDKLPANVKFTGFVPNVLDAFNSLDIFIFPSYEENQGMAILEAAAVGLPIIVRDIPVYEGWLVHGENCLKAKTDEEFEACVRSLIEDSSLRAKLSAASLVLAKKESIEEQGKEMRKILESLLK